MDENGTRRCKLSAEFDVRAERLVSKKKKNEFVNFYWIAITSKVRTFLVQLCCEGLPMYSVPAVPIKPDLPAPPQRQERQERQEATTCQALN